MSFMFNPYNYENKNQNCFNDQENHINKNDSSDCNCYKKDLRESFELLGSNLINSYVNFSSFTLYGQSARTAQNATTLKSLATCNCDLIEYTDGTPFTSASLCDLVAYSFQLLNPTVNLPLFVTGLQNILCNCKGYCNNNICPQPTCNCNCDCDDCCCTDGIASRLMATLGTVNIFVRGNIDPILNATVLAVTDRLVYLSTATAVGCPSIPAATIYVVPLDNIELIG